MIATDPLLRTNGGRTVLLRIPAPPIANDPTEELGLATPQFNSIPLEPAVFLRGTRLLVSATAVARAAGTLNLNGAEELFTGNTIVVDSTPYTITHITTEQASGQPFCYALTLAPQ